LIEKKKQGKALGRRKRAGVIVEYEGKAQDVRA